MKPTYTELVDALRGLLDAEERHRIASQEFRSGEIGADQMIHEDDVVLKARVRARMLLARDARAYPRNNPVAGLALNLQLEAARAMGLIGGHELQVEGRVHA